MNVKAHNKGKTLFDSAELFLWLEIICMLESRLLLQTTSGYKIPPIDTTELSTDYNLNAIECLLRVLRTFIRRLNGLITMPVKIFELLSPFCATIQVYSMDKCKIQLSERSCLHDGQYFEMLSMLCMIDKESYFSNLQRI